MEFAITVSELTTHIKRTIEDGFSQVKIIGEISNFKSHVSGHWYFTLKDSGAQINCTMWKGINSNVFFTPQNGMKVIITGRITVYPPRGTYQLDARSLKPAGEGELQKAFDDLKRKLKEEGLFEVENKKEIPSFPKNIGIVTGKDTAAFKDMLSVAERRFPLVNIIIAGARVQGEGAAEQISESINRLNKRKDIDIIIIARGGGSLEDLWAFNEEITVRAIFNSKIPVISGVGHEIDFTISDFVSDLRAPTPSAAMELATPNLEEINSFLTDFLYNIKNSISEKLEDFRQKVNYVSMSFGFKNIRNIINNKKQTVDNNLYRMHKNIEILVNNRLNVLEVYDKTIQSNNVDTILKKGFVLVKNEDGFIKRKKELDYKKELNLIFIDGKVKVKEYE